MEPSEEEEERFRVKGELVQSSCIRRNKGDVAEKAEEEARSRRGRLARRQTADVARVRCDCVYCVRAYVIGQQRRTTKTKSEYAHRGNRVDDEQRRQLVQLHLLLLPPLKHRRQPRARPLHTLPPALLDALPEPPKPLCSTRPRSFEEVDHLREGLRAR